MKRNKKLTFVAITIFFIFFLYKKYKEKETNILLENNIVTVGKIIRILPKSKSLFGWQVQYFFVLDKDTIYNETNALFKSINRFKNEQGYFPVVYEKNNIKNNTMLINSRDFDSFKITMPDSLNWIKKIEYNGL